MIKNLTKWQLFLLCGWVVAIGCSFLTVNDWYDVLTGVFIISYPACFLIDRITKALELSHAKRHELDRTWIKHIERAYWHKVMEVNEIKNAIKQAAEQRSRQENDA